MKFNIFEKIGFDGAKHIILSSIIALVLSYIFPWYVVASITICIGIVKELYDKFSKKGYPEIKDVLCDIVGIIIGIL